MLSLDNRATFLALVRLGLGKWDDTIVVPKGVDWDDIDVLANEQGLSSIVVDGLEKLPEAQKPSKPVLLQWVGETLQNEQQCAVQHKVACKMAVLFHQNEIRTYVLKGAVVAECYPNPEHRLSSDMDCYLLPQRGDFDAWSLGNNLIKSHGFKVSTSFYKNSTFYLPGLTVENHRFLTPFRGNKKLTLLERVLQSLLADDSGVDRFDGTWLYRPPVMVSALFLIEHSYSHFLHEGLTWRHVLDWVMFVKKHKAEIDWPSLSAYVDEFGFRKFYDAYLRMGQYLMGELTEGELANAEKRMLSDIWAPLDLHETLHGVKGKLGLVRSTLRARWKYRLFGDISMLHALWIQVYGFLFMKNPKLC